MSDEPWKFFAYTGIIIEGISQNENLPLWDVDTKGTKKTHVYFCGHFNGLVQERHNTIANALELLLSCTNPSILSL